MSTPSTDNRNPRITVVIANRNYGRYLADCIRSAKEQTLKPYCVALYDDASEDDSLLFKDSVDLFIRGESPVGPSAARNRIIEKTWDQTDFFAVLDADDYWDSRRLEICIKEFQNNVVGAVYTDNYSLNVDSDIKTREFRESFSLQRLLQQNYIHSGCLIRKEILSKTGLYSEDMRTAEDWDLWLRIAKFASFHHIPYPLVTARVHKNNSTFSVDASVWRENWNKISNRIRTLYV